MHITPTYYICLVTDTYTWTQLYREDNDFSLTPLYIIPLINFITVRNFIYFYFIASYKLLDKFILKIRNMI